MKKEELRKEFFKLRMKNHSYNQCRKILKAQLGYEGTIRTLQRWSRKLEKDDWDLRDKSTRLLTIQRKITSDVETEVIKLRKETGWGAIKM